jgi:hypothetical protein
MRPSSGVIVFVTAAKWCSGVSVVERIAWVTVVRKRVVVEGVTESSSDSLSYSLQNTILLLLQILLLLKMGAYARNT